MNNIFTICIIPPIAGIIPINPITHSLSTTFTKKPACSPFLLTIFILRYFFPIVCAVVASRYHWYITKQIIPTTAPKKNDSGY